MSLTVNSRRYDGSIKRSWFGEIVEQTRKGVSISGVFDRNVQHSDLGLIEKGTLTFEWFWFDRSYSLFRFDLPDGSLRNYYFNINLPPTLSGDVLDFVDLDVDILVWPNGDYKILDLDEFEESKVRFGYPRELILEVNAVVLQLENLIVKGVSDVTLDDF